MEQLLEKADREWQENPGRLEALRLPLIRLKVTTLPFVLCDAGGRLISWSGLLCKQVDLCGFPAINDQRFGTHFVNRVANPGSMLHMPRRSARRATGGAWAHVAMVLRPDVAPSRTHMCCALCWHQARAP